LAVAAALDVGLATMILGGLVVGAFTASAGYVYALYANKRWDVPLRESAGLTDEDSKRIDSRDPATLPALWLSLLPILLPVVTISVAATVEARGMTGGWVGIVRTLGDKNISLTIAAGIGLLMMFMQPACAKGSTGKAVAEALASAGVIILVTSAGGAFGYVLRQTDIAASISHLVPAGKLAILPLAFLLAALVRTAQGSATVAMITSAGIVSPLAVGVNLGFHPVYLALAIGCGSKPVMWMNDSGFWIIGKMSGFTEGETLKTATVMMAVMGVVGLVVVMIGAWVIPLV
jgi:GntP family gluconate:H+ symporter